MKKLILSLTILILFFLAPVYSFQTIASAASIPEVKSESYILIEMKTGQVLLEHNADKRHAPASTTKIMTALVALERANSDDIMIASKRATSGYDPDYILAHIKPGEKLTFKELLQLMLITSANETANIIAENVSPTGDIEGFIKLMNKKARSLKLQNTHYQNTYGFDNENHYSTARDLAYIAREAMKIQQFRNIVASSTVPRPKTNFHNPSDWPSILSVTNQLISNSKYKSDIYLKATGIKTGTTNKAGKCLVSSAIDKKGLELICVVLGAKTYPQLFSESKKLLEYGFKNFSFQYIVKNGEKVKKVPVEDGREQNEVMLLTQGEIFYILPITKSGQKVVSYKETIKSPIKAPITKGQILGRRDYYYKDSLIGSINLVAANNIDKKLSAKIRDQYKQWTNNPKARSAFTLVFSILFGFLLLRIVLKIISRKINKRKRLLRRSKHYRINRFR